MNEGELTDNPKNVFNQSNLMNAYFKDEDCYAELLNENLD